MGVVTIDAYGVVKDLRSAGFTDEQAEALARTMREAQDLNFSHLATKADGAESKAEIIKGMFGTIGFQTLIILGAVIALARLIKP